MADSAWRRQKIASLQNQADWEYTIGPGYYDIPTDVVLRGGLRGDDRRHENVHEGFDSRRPNLPRDPQQLYRPHNCRRENEYVLWDAQEVAIGMAPIFVQTLVPQAGQLSALYAKRQPLGRDMSNGARFVDLPDEAIQRNPNIVGQGIIQNNLTLPLPPQGRVNNYTLPANFSFVKRK